MNELPTSLHAARDALKKRAISATELVAGHLTRAKELEPLNHFISLCTDEALSTAEEADRARARGEDLGVLHGVPVSAKDIVHSKGHRTTSGSKIYAGFVPSVDAPALARLRAAGAILIGKTNLHEFAYGVTNDNPHYGPALNPWDRERICGGSSGGSGASLAAGVAYGSIGTDTGGSIRIPASLCGVVGLKPTYERVPRQGVTPLSWSLDHVGPMARTVADVALLYEVLAEDWTVEDQLEEPVSGLKMGLHRRYFFDGLDPEVEAAVEGAISVLRELGLEPVEVDVPEVELQTACRNTITFAEAASYHEPDLRRRPDDYGSGTLELLRLGLLVPATEYLAALRVRGLVIRAFQRLFEQIDILVAPATAVPAPLIGEEKLPSGEPVRAGLLRLSSPFNTTGLPAVSVPGGFTAEGLPIGLQLAAGPWQEATLLKVARAYERARGPIGREPVV